MAADQDNNYRALKWGAAVLSVLVCAGLFWYALQERNQRELLTVHADDAPYKVRPEDPGGLQVPHQDKRIYGEAVGRPDKPEENLARGKEQPVDIKTLKDKPTPPPIAEEVVAEEATPVAELVAEPEPEAKKEPEPAPAPEPDKTEVPIEITEVPKMTNTAPAGSWGVQLGAFSTELAADRAWSTLRKDHASVLGALVSHVRKPGEVGQDNLYRLWAGGFAAEADARAACEALKKAGQGCLPVQPFQAP